MTETPPLAAYTVALSFAEGGPIHVNAVIAPSEVAAAAMVAVNLMRQMPTDKELMGVAIAQLTPEFLRVALRAYEGVLKPGGANVLSIVRPSDEAHPPHLFGQRAAELLRRDTLTENAGGKYTDPEWPHPPKPVA